MDIVAMPQLGETVTEGTITAWSVEVGDRVEVDDALFEVSTEKVDTEVPSAVAGHVRAVLVEAGATVAVGTPVAVITPNPDDPFDLPVPGVISAHGSSDVSSGGSFVESSGVSIGDSSVDSSRDTSGPGRLASGQRPTSSPAPPATLADSGPVGAIQSLSPVVSRLLAEHRLDPSTVAGSGRGGRITRNDVLAAAAQRVTTPGPSLDASGSPSVVSSPSSTASQQQPSAPPAPPIEVGPGDEVIDFSRARAATADHMRRSLGTAAHALVVVEVDYHRIETVRRSLGLSYLPFVARAVIESLREFPHLNASVDGDRLVVRRRVRLGVAVDVDQEALMVPVIHEADDLRLPALGAAITDVADRARRRRLKGSELEGGTFTVTNVGSYGTVMAVPIINQPQVGILSTDGIRMRPVAIRTDPASDKRGSASAEWGVAVHPVGNLSLSFDHRAVDGAYAAAFLASVRDVVESRDWAGET